MSWNVAKHCLFTAALFHPPTPWLDDELEEMAAECASDLVCSSIRRQVAGLAASLEEREAAYARLFVDGSDVERAHPGGSLARQAHANPVDVSADDRGAFRSRRERGAPGGRVADYIAADLEFLAWLMEEGAVTDARWLLNHHLRAWVPGILEAIRNADPHPFYRDAAEMLDSTLALAHAELAPELELAEAF